ncbi:MAG: DUF5615 family PIN-like protein [Caldilineaceae bacterium]|nr:DUF5615 family PIN-like protein [Caldilineaceae bacterium]
MRIFVDENIPLMTVTELRSLGHDVHDIRGTVDEGMQDDALWDMAQQEKRILITTDKGFTHYRMRQHHGVLVIQLRQPNRRKIHARIMQALTRFPDSEWPGLLVVMRDIAQSSWRVQGRH